MGNLNTSRHFIFHCDTIRCIRNSVYLYYELFPSQTRPFLQSSCRNWACAFPMQLSGIPGSSKLHICIDYNTLLCCVPPFLLLDNHHHRSTVGIKCPALLSTLLLDISHPNRSRGCEMPEEFDKRVFICIETVIKFRTMV